MPTFFVNTDDARISNAFLATLGAAPGSTYLAQIKAFGLVNSVNAMIAATGKTTAADLATTITGNLGLTGAAATAGQAYLTSVTLAGASSTWAANLISTLDLFTTLQNDATYGTAASAYVARINSAVAYSAVATNNSTDLGTLAAAAGSAGSAGAGSSLTLGTGIDNISGSSGNDTISGVFSAASGAGTLGSSDTISGGAGTDTLSIRVVEATDDSTVVPSISGIEIVTIDNDATADSLSLNLTGVSGVTNVNSSGSSAGSITEITDLAATVTVGMTNAKGTFTLDFVSTVHNTSADAITVNLNGAGDAATGGTAAKLVLDATGSTTATAANDTLETITISSSTAASRLDLIAGTSLKTLNVSGDAKVTLTDTDDNFTAVTTVSGATLTGALDIDLSGNTKNVTLTTGTGDDRVKLGAVDTGLTGDDSLNLGTGTDIAAVSDSSFTAAQIATIKSRLTTAETLELYSNLASASYSFSSISIINNLRFSGTNVGTAGSSGATGAANDGTNGGVTIALSGIESGDSITVAANTTGGAGGAAGTAGSAGHGEAAISFTPAIDGGADSFTVNLTGGVTITGGAGGSGFTGSTAGNGAAGISASSFEVLNIVSTGTSANAIAGGVAGSGDMTAGTTGASIVINTNGTINVSGTRDVNIGTISGTNATVDGSSFTGKLTATGEAGNNSMKGGSAVDTLDGGAGIDTLTGNGGADIFNFKLGSGATTNSQSTFMSGATGVESTGSAGTALSVDSITDYTKGSDLISITDSSGAAVTLASTGVVAFTGVASGTAAISSTGVATFNSADDTLLERVIAVADAIKEATGGTSAGDFAYFEFDGNSYVFVSDGTNQLTGGDVLIKLTGVTGLTSVAYSSGDIILS